MITIEEKISVSQDDPLAKQIEKQLTGQDGWQISETTVVKTYRRIQFIGIGDTDETDTTKVEAD